MFAIVTMFAIAVVLWTLDLANFIMEAKVTLIQDPDVPIDTKVGKALSFIFRLASAQDALYSYMSLLGDAIIIWRVWMLKAYYRPWVLLFPIAFLLGSLVATLMLTFCVARVGSDIVIGTFQHPAFCKNVQMATYSMALATTTVATILIGLTTWNYRTSIKPMLSHGVTTSGGTRGTRRSQVEGILMLLVESGLLYFLFFAIQVVGDVPRVHDWVATQAGVSFAFVMYSYCSSCIVGMYPTIIVVIAHSQRTMFDNATLTTSTLQIGRPGEQSSGWPALQPGTGTKREDEIELDTGLHSSSHDEVENGKP
ncbi:hypothetical protein B0H10DRAFT_311242 [Mycena sp. CBHHK59/15]|nr:hypothetical protein B0H10DRAFT_311242 [Mycena sp. CBHHK59/15]